MNDFENISPQESLARKFESWQKQYYDDVYSFFQKRDRERLLTAFNSWEQKFSWNSYKKNYQSLQRVMTIRLSQLYLLGMLAILYKPLNCLNLTPLNLFLHNVLKMQGRDI